jgi:hypothetical protein
MRITPPCIAGAARPFWIMAGLCISAALVRAPFLSSAGVDESFYLVVARQWLEGTPPYAGAFDVKPPLLFALMAFAETIFGPALIAAKALAMAAVAIASCGLYLFGRRFLGELSGVAAALFYIVSTVSLGGALSPAELLMAPFTAFGMLAGFSAAQAARFRVLSMLAAGFLFGAAFCVKQTALFEALPLAAYLLFGRPFAKGLYAIGLFAAGFCIIPAAFALYFYAHGHLDALVAHAVVSAVARAGAYHAPWSDAFVRFSIEIALLLPLALMAAAMIALRNVFREDSIHRATVFLGGWAAGAFAAVLATRAMCDFYMLAALPSLCLLSGAYFEHGMGRLRGLIVPIGRAAVALSAVLFFAGAVRAISPIAGDGEGAAKAAAQAMRSAGLSPKDRIFAVDRDLIVYLTSGANPPGPVFHPIQILCDVAAEETASALAGALNSRPAFMVVSEPRVALDCEKPGRRALIDAALAAHYRPIGHFDAGLAGLRPRSFDLYRRVDRPLAP